MTLRVSERSGLLTTTRVSWRWLELVLVIGVVAAIQRSALAVYTGKIAAALILLAFYVAWVRRHLHFSRKAIDLQAYRKSLRYGLPLVANELAAMSLIAIDRIMLKHLQGDYEGVGVFTVGCALAMQIGVLMNDPLMGAFDPAANRLHGTDGAAEVRALKRRTLLPVTYACIGVGVAIWAVGREAIEMLAGVDKSASGPVFAWLGAIFALLPLLNVSGYGLLLQHRTMTVLALTAVAAATNVGLNFLWIPTHGVMGAVYATAVAYAVLSVGKCVLCPRELLQWPDRKSLLTAVSAALVFMLVVQGTGLFGLSSPWSRIVAAGGLWLFLFALPAVALDSRLRQVVFKRRGAHA
jgi:O-antigen/teichoic acid export membrane protein